MTDTVLYTENTELTKSLLFSQGIQSYQNRFQNEERMPILANGIAFDEGANITQSPRLRSEKGVDRGEADSGKSGCEEGSRFAAEGLLATIYQE